MENTILNNWSETGSKKKKTCGTELGKNEKDGLNNQFATVSCHHIGQE